MSSTVCVRDRDIKKKASMASNVSVIRSEAVVHYESPGGSIYSDLRRKEWTEGRMQRGSGIRERKRRF